MRVAMAVLFMLAFALVGLGMLRSLWRTPKSVPLQDPVDVPVDVRITFWCGTCGTEVLLMRRGSEAAPRHCGEPMKMREEVLRAD